MQDNEEEPWLITKTLFAIAVPFWMIKVIAVMWFPRMRFRLFSWVIFIWMVWAGLWALINR